MMRMRHLEVSIDGWWAVHAKQGKAAGATSQATAGASTSFLFRENTVSLKSKSNLISANGAWPSLLFGKFLPHLTSLLGAFSALQIHFQFFSYKIGKITYEWWYKLEFRFCCCYFSLVLFPLRQLLSLLWGGSMGASVKLLKTKLPLREGGRLFSKNWKFEERVSWKRKLEKAKESGNRQVEKGHNCGWKKVEEDGVVLKGKDSNTVAEA